MNVITEKQVVYDSDKWNAWIQDSGLNDTDVSEYYLNKKNPQRGEKSSGSEIKFIFQEVFADMIASGTFKSAPEIALENFEINIENAHQPELYSATTLDVVITNKVNGKRGVYPTYLAPYGPMKITGYIVRALANAFHDAV